MISPGLFFMLWIALAILGCFVVPHQFYDCFSSSVKNAFGILMDIALNL
jgi:hypothetical protein